MHKPNLIASLAGVMLILTACQVDLPSLLPGTGEAAGGTPVPPDPTPQLGTSTAAASATPTSDLGETPEPTGGPETIVLTVWMPDRLAPSTETPGGQAFLEELAAFDEAYPTIQVEVYIKRTSGPGGILSYLRTAPPVAPGVLPDLALLRRDALLQAAGDSLIVPIEPLVREDLIDALYPVAVDVGTVNGVLMGLPYVLDMQHVVYRETLFTSAPDEFVEVLESPVTFDFPAAPLGSVNQTTLLQYLAAGGTLTDEDGVPLLDVAALTRVLTFYADAREAGVIDPAVFQITDVSETWGRYRDRQSGLAVVSASQYLAERDQVRTTGLAPVPTEAGGPAALATGWSWVMVTRDPDRQAAALLLLEALMDPASQGTYTRAASRLPSQPAALMVWGEDDRYVTFGDQLLRAARLLPDEAQQAVVGDAIQNALEEVLLNGVSPVQAASNAGQAVNPPEGAVP
ncbi:MAG: hypothetical protein Kow00124_14190 [Anaerolineae bacterium]